jgi:hypothetical protein
MDTGQVGQRAGAREALWGEGPSAFASLIRDWGWPAAAAENQSRQRPSVGQHGQAGCWKWGQMTAPDGGRGSPARKRAVLLALRYYGRQMIRLRRFTVPAMLLPALGNTCIFYVAPLIVAQLVGRLVSHGSVGIGAAMPYVLGFAGVLLFAETLWGSASTA